MLGGGSQDSLWLGEVQTYKATWNRVDSREVHKSLFGSEEVHRYKATWNRVDFGEVQKTLFGSEEVHRCKATWKGVGSGGGTQDSL